MDWQPIETMPQDGRQVRIKYSGGDEAVVSASPMTALSRTDAVTLAKVGVWPDHKRWTATHWAPLDE